MGQCGKQGGKETRAGGGGEGEEEVRAITDWQSLDERHSRGWAEAGPSGAPRQTKWEKL
jgi:hypothetical protein